MPTTAQRSDAVGGCRRFGRFRGFTLVELLVVVAIIVALLAILLPAMGRATYVAQVAVCGSDHHQLGVASLAYAADNFGAYSTGTIPGSIGLNVWGMHQRGLLDLAEYGAGHQMWFCPLLPPESAWTHPNSVGFNVPASVIATGDTQTVYDYMLSHSFPSLNLIVTQRMYWGGPRKATNGYTSHDGLGATRNVHATSQWPVSLARPGTGGHPLWSDLLYVHPQDGPLGSADLLRGGHAYGGRIDSVNAVWPDGSVRLRMHGQFELRLDQHYGNWY